MIARYAESDDTARTELVEHVSDEQLRAPPGPHQDVALALDSFAQAAMEARFELGRRQ